MAFGLQVEAGVDPYPNILVRYRLSIKNNMLQAFGFMKKQAPTITGKPFSIDFAVQEDVKSKK